MRLFAAVVPPPDALAELEAALPSPPPAEVRLVPAHQRHLTVAFYASVPDAAVEELTERLRRACARTAPMSLRLNGFGTFPANASKARVLWTGVDGDVAGLTRLAERAAAAAKRVGIAVEDRRYRPHLTIGRARQGAVDVRELVAEMRLGGSPWTAAELHLIKSTLGAEVHHEPIERFAFGA